LFFLINIFDVIKIVVPITIIDYWDKYNTFQLKNYGKGKRL